MRLRLMAFSRAPAVEAAEREGYFAAERIELTYERTESSIAQLAALQAGQCDLVHTAADNVLARVDGGERDLAVCLVADIGVDLRLVARGARSVADLAGRLLGVDSPESGHALLLYALLERAGVPHRDQQVVAVGGSGRRAAALHEGRVDAALLSPPHDAEAVAEGAAVLADCRSEFPEHPGLTIAVRPSWASRNDALVVGYLRALIRGQRAVEAAVPSVAAQRHALSGALTLRRSLLGGTPPSEEDIDRVLDPRYATRADPSLA